MCYTAKLPSVIKSENFNSDLLNLTRVFNRWLKMLTGYGKLDETAIESDSAAISTVIKSATVTKDIKRAVQSCREYAFAEETSHWSEKQSYLQCAQTAECQIFNI